MKNRHRLAAAAALVLAAGQAADAQVVINEVFSNPPGSGSAGDDRWEYIELYGAPGTPLTGYMVASVFGGGDPNGNGIPGPRPSGWDQGDEVAEIDEAWTLDGLSLGANGFLVIYNANGASAGRPSFVPALLPAATARVTFEQAHIPTTDTAGRLKNDGSATFVLVRKRPNHSINALGQSVYAPGYAWRKDVNPDCDFDGRIDFNGLGTLVIGGGPNPPEAPVQSEDPAPLGTVPGPLSLEPYQMIDEIAWSNGGGKEYTRSQQHEIADTAAFNPDAVSRVAFYGAAPDRGWRLNAGVAERTRLADEEFVYGDVPSVTGATSLFYDTTLSGAPTNPAGAHYNALGQPDAAGTYLFDDYTRAGFKLTPGTFNDGQAGSPLTQFRFVRGDFNFDGAVNCLDKDLIEARVGASLDDTEIKVNGHGTPAAGDDFTYTGWTWQGREAQAILAMRDMSTTDGPGGLNAPAVTAADAAAFLTLLGPVACGNPCPADWNADLEVNGNDISDYINSWYGDIIAGTVVADFNGDGETNGNDISDYINAWYAAIVNGGYCA